MNERIRLLVKQAQVLSDQFQEQWKAGPSNEEFFQEKFAELIVRECNQAVLNVPCYYKDYRSQIEEAIINNCARAVLEHLGVEE